MLTCPSCLAQFPEGTSLCPTDGASLLPEETLANVDRELAAGTLVGEYRIEGKLGEGGFGAVYRAVHPLIGKSAAVKILSRQFSSNPQMVSRFVAEARAVNQIRHKNIIDIFSFGQLPDGRQYYVMELLEGTPFDRYIAARGKLSLAEALPILQRVARALDAAHGKGLLHRDLKPENVFLVTDDEGSMTPKLLDFGLVKLLGEQSGQHATKTGTPMGTPYYMSPEQCRGKEVDVRTDVYSFGAMVFEVLSGTVPFDGESAMDILLKHMTAEVPSLTSRVPEIPLDVDRAVRHMLAKEPQDRPASVGAAMAELMSAQSGMGTFPTMVDVASSPALPLPSAATSATGEKVQTFLGAEADVPQARPKSKTPLAVIAGAVVLALAGALLAVTTTSRKEVAHGIAPAEPPAAKSAPATSVASAAAVPSAEPPAPADVDLRIDGAPAGAVVLADGKELGKGAGPFHLKRGAPVKITVTAKGYKPRDVALSPTDNVVLPVTLDKQTAAPTKSKAVHSDIPSFD